MLPLTVVSPGLTPCSTGMNWTSPLTCKEPLTQFALPASSFILSASASGNSTVIAGLWLACGPGEAGAAGAAGPLRASTAPVTALLPAVRCSVSTLPVLI